MYFSLFDIMLGIIIFYLEERDLTKHSIFLYAGLAMIR